MEGLVIEINSLLHKIEEKYRTYNWELYGIKVWPLIKKEIIFSEFSGHSKSRKNEIPKNFKALSIEQFKEQVEGEFDFFFVFDPVRLIQHNGEVKNRISGPIAEMLKEKGYKVANVQYENSGNISEHLFEDDCSMLLTTDYINSFYNKVYEEYAEIGNYDEARSYFFSHEKKLRFPTLDKINEIASLIYALSVEFQEILIKYQVKAVFVEIYTHIVSSAWILAANKLNIKTVEIQHGILDPNLWFNFGYIPSNSYETMPRNFLTLDNYSLNSIKMWADQTNNTQVFEIENLWVHNFLNNKLNAKQTDSKNVLITLQPQLGAPEWDFNLPSWLIEYIKKSDANITWYLRYHPLMKSNYIKEIVNVEQTFSNEIRTGKVEIQYANSQILLDLLAEVDVHLTLHSYSAIEAALLSTPTIFVHERAKEIFKEYQEFQELFSYITTLDDFEKNLCRIIDGKKNLIANSGQKDMLVNKALEIIFSDLTVPIKKEFSEYKYLDLEKEIFNKSEDQFSEEMLIKIVKRLFKLKKFDTLIEVYEKKGDFSNLDILYIVSKAYYQNQLYEKSTDLALKYLKVYEKNDFLNMKATYNEQNFYLSILYYLGMSYKIMGEYSKALIWFGKCVKKSQREHQGAKQQILMCREKLSSHYLESKKGEI